MVVLEASEAETFLNALPRLARNIRAKIPKLRGRVEDKITVLKRRSVDMFTGAVDSAFPRTPLELLGFSIAPLAAVAIEAKGSVTSTTVEKKILYSFDESISSETIASHARMLERKLMLKLISKGVDILLVDGELVVQGLGSKLYEYSLTVLGEAVRRSRMVVGVIKRSRSRILAEIAGVDMNDKALAAIILKPCEAIVVPHPDNRLQSLNCMIVYYKPPRGLNSVKAEVCGDISLLGDIACSSGWSGLPWLIDVVDALAKSEAERLYRIVENSVKIRAVAEGILELALPLNPQEEGSRPRRIT